MANTTSSNPYPAAETTGLIPEVLRSVFGNELLAYVLAMEPEEKITREDTRRRETLEYLRQQAEPEAPGLDSHSKRFFLLQNFNRVNEGVQSVVNQLRALNGGTIPEPLGDDRVESVLCTLATDLFPIELLPAQTAENPDPFVSGPSLDMTVALHSNPGVALFAKAFLEDKELCALFPDYEEGADDSPRCGQPFPMNVTSDVIWSTGSGGSLSLGMLPQSILAYVFALMRIDGKLTVENVPSYVRRATEVVRGLVSKRRTKLPIVAALSNIGSDGQIREVPLDAGRLVLAEGLSRAFNHLPSSARAVLMVETDVQLLEIMSWDPTGDPLESRNHRRWAHRSRTIDGFSRATAKDLMRARLAFALSSETDVVAPTVVTWTVPNPLSGGSSSWATNQTPHAPYPGAIVDSALAASIEEWSHRLRAHPESLWLGARRLVAATTERTDSLDAFVDAVVCWENMLGTDEGEVAFRVCGGLALLLQPDDSRERLALFRELKELYKARSGLVHGSREPEPADALEKRNRAVRIAIDAMRSLHDRPELRDAQNSTERNRVLLLGA